MPTCWQAEPAKNGCVHRYGMILLCYELERLRRTTSLPWQSCEPRHDYQGCAEQISRGVAKCELSMRLIAQALQLLDKT